jgi:hypothetical protein
VEHDLELRGRKNEWRLDALDEWRREIVDPTLARHDGKLAEIVKADEIAEAVAAKLNEGQAKRMTEGVFKLDRWQTRIAGGGLALALAVSVAGGIKGLI